MAKIRMTREICEGVIESMYVAQLLMIDKTRDSVRKLRRCGKKECRLQAAYLASTLPLRRHNAAALQFAARELRGTGPAEAGAANRKGRK
jgi:hypothetical protein